MNADTLRTWAQLLVAIPGLIVAWKLPTLWRWCHMKLSTAFATALMAQLAPRLETLEKQLEEVRHQVYPNSGGSMHDRLSRVLSSTERTETSVNLLRGTMRAHQDADLHQARFEACANGLFVWVSHAFLRWTARSTEQVTGFGWVNCVAHADRDRVRAEWESAVSEKREFSSHFLMHALGGEDFAVEAYAKPVRSGAQDETLHFVGVITKALRPA